MADLSGLRLDLQRALDQSLDWLVEVRTAGLLPSARLAEQDIATVERLRSRATSSLISIGFLGAFSSGKSFLLSGLQGLLELREVISGDTVADQYIGLLPSAPTPTNACPTTVLPVRDHYPEWGYLRVRFTDTGQWEDVGPVTSPLLIAGYVMTQSAFVTGRLPKDWHREVAEVELLISEHVLPAKLYDLPGHGSVNATHDAIVRSKMQDADAYIYVANAARTLADDDLQMIRFLYEHHKISKKRVIWVVTAIDRGLDLGLDGRPGWQHTVETNNEYLRENFQIRDGEPDTEFIGRGFVPVSPALEARGRKELAAPDDRARSRGRGLLAQSRMDDLRAVVHDMITRETGGKHIALIAAEALTMIEPTQRMHGNLLEAQRLPVDQLRAGRDDLSARRDVVHTAVTSAAESLQWSLQGHVRAAERPFADKHGLAARLHERLDAVIMEADVRKPKVANQIEVQQTQVVEEWMSHAEGPYSIWRREFEAFTQDALRVALAALESSTPFGQVGAVQPLTVQQLLVPRPDRSRTEIQDVVQVAAGVTGAIAPIAGGVAAMLVPASGGLLLIPAGITVGAALLYSAIAYRKKTSNSLDLERREWVAHLDQVAEEIRQRFVTHAGLEGSEVIARTQQILTEHRDQLVQGILAIERRMASPETQQQEGLIERLTPICRAGEAIVRSLRELMNQGGTLRQR